MKTTEQMMKEISEIYQNAERTITSIEIRAAQKVNELYASGIKEIINDVKTRYNA